MKRQLVLTLSLFLYGVAPARAEASNAPPIKLFGKTVCFANAPREARCDYRLPVAAPSTGQRTRL